MPKKKKEEHKELKDPNVESVEWREIEYTCPVRGKVKQKVKVIKYKQTPAPVQNNIVKTGNPMIDDFSLGELADMEEEQADDLN